jgi:hypothetical protein
MASKEGFASISCYANKGEIKRQLRPDRRFCFYLLRSKEGKPTESIYLLLANPFAPFCYARQTSISKR